MKLALINPTKSLNPAYQKQSLNRRQINLFKAELLITFNHIDENQDEEYHKNLISKLLLEVYCKDKYLVNVNKKQDLVIRDGNKINDEVAVILEFKKPSEKRDMVSKDKPNVKALQELVLYYLRETVDKQNHKIKHLIATNIYDWYIFDELWFEKNIFKNTKLKNDYENWKVSGHNTQHFYDFIATKYLDSIEEDVPCTHFNLKDFEQIISNDDENDDDELIDLYKILSPEHLLKKPFVNDSNTLDKGFYNELLHILGLEETKDGGKTIIERKVLKNRDEGSLLENTINVLQREKRFGYDDDIETQRKYFELALELCITWLNRILFLKLLEGQLFKYHRGDKTRLFLNANIIKDFDELDELFFEVLAVPTDQRTKSVTDKYGVIPYLNSSLFEPTDAEKDYSFIRSLKDRLEISIFNSTVLKDGNEKRFAGKKNTLHYLFDFLDAYDFASDSKAKIQEQNKNVINAAVLGLIFEKINGYRDGSFFTPGFITEYMCRETISRAVVKKFNEVNNWTCNNFDDIEQKLDYTDKAQRRQANDIINSIKICDPAVGSGHFLVSTLNELIAIKSELKILNYRDGNRVKDYKISIVNDQLIIKNKDDDNDFEYTLNQNGKPIDELQLLQETLFHEKQTIIENCLFGVDINPKSVMICRLRLWVELLKNSYYTEKSNYQQLETLPNIDINIKCGNSLISRFAVKDDVFETIPNFIKKVDDYKFWVSQYKEANDKKLKEQLHKQIGQFKDEFKKRDPRIVDIEKKITKASEEIIIKYKSEQLFGNNLTDKQLKHREILENSLKSLVDEKDSIIKNDIYENAFEWRYEFPEVLDENGQFQGFDVVIGNPPYIRQEEFAEIKPFLLQRYKVYNSIADLLTYFVELGFDILRPNGTFQFIISNKFTRANYGKQLRTFLAKNTQLTHFIDFSGVPVFDEATVDAVIVGFLKSVDNCSYLTYANIKKNKFYVNEFTNYLNQIKLLYPQHNLNENTWAFETDEVLKIKQKVEAQGVPLKKWDITINYGIKTGLNDAFVIDRIKRAELIAQDSRSTELLKPMLRGRDIQKYCPDYQDLWLIYIPKGYTIKKILADKGNVVDEPMPRYGYVEFDEAWEWFKNQFPAIGNHLIQYRKIAEKRADMGDYWWEQRACAYLDSFEKPKIIYPNMTKFLPFVIDLEDHYYHNDKSFQILTDRIYWLGAFLNSTLFKYCFKDNFAELLGGTRELRKVFFEPIPVMQISEEQEKPFEKLAQEIINLKKTDPQADTSKFEKEIDEMVYKLYNLTEEEKKIIENN